MIYDTKDKFERKKLFARLKTLIRNGKLVDLKQVSEKRTIKQNSYLHKLFSLYGIENGYSLSEAKQLIKSVLDYTYIKDKNMFYVETSKMDTKELTVFIDRFRNFAASNGCYLPSADEYNGKLAYFENEIEKNRQYL